MTKAILAYNTVLTTLRIMADKGYVTFRKEGRAHIFQPSISKSGARRLAIGSLLTALFDGSPRSLAHHLVEDEKLTLEDIETLRTRLLEREDG